MQEIFYARAFKKHGVERTPVYQFCYLIGSLSDSPRRCMDPVDYVYGVLGMLQIKIPRMIDPKKVWQRFLSELDDYMDMAGFKNEVVQEPDGSKVKIIGIRKCAYEIDLTTVKCMGGIYHYILRVEDVE